MSHARELRALTGLRGVAALSVALAHFGFARFAAIRPLIFSDVAVDIFFCLSGFTLCYAYRAGTAERLAIWPYLRARFARLYPLYVLALVLTWWLVFRHLGGSGFYPERLYRGDAIRQFLMVNSWPLIGTGLSWDMPAWSLSIEVFCYLAVFPPLFALTRRALAAPPARLLCLLVIASFVPVVCFLEFWDLQLVSLSPGHVATAMAHWVGLIRGIGMFVAGWVVFLLWHRAGALREAAAAACDATALAFVLVQATITLGVLYPAYLALLGPPLVLALAASERSIAARLLAAPPFHKLGEMSYSIYLLHGPLNYELHHEFPALAAHSLRDVVVTLAVVLMASFLSYRFFELPMRNWLKAPARPRAGFAAPPGIG